MHGRHDLLDQDRDVRRAAGAASGRLGVDGGAHGAALVVAEHDDERNVEHADGVLERAEHRVGDDLAGVAHDEQVAEALVEDDLGREPGVAAAEERGVRPLCRWASEVR